MTAKLFCGRKLTNRIILLHYNARFLIAIQLEMFYNFDPPSLQFGIGTVWLLSIYTKIILMRRWWIELTIAWIFWWCRQCKCLNLDDICIFYQISFSCYDMVHIAIKKIPCVFCLLLIITIKCLQYIAINRQFEYKLFFCV